MSKTAIEWATDVWNPTVGCTKVTAGCLNCYAEVLDRRFHETRYNKPFVPWTVAAQTRAREKRERWADPLFLNRPAPANLPGPAVHLHPERLEQPLHWRQSKDGSRRRIFVDSMSDLFHEDVPDEFIARVWATMMVARQHDFLILTKRPERAAEFLTCKPEYGHTIGERPSWPVWWASHAVMNMTNMPLPNVWIGTSITGWHSEGGRLHPTEAAMMEALARIPAAVRFVSYEPALGPVDWSQYTRFLNEHPDQRAIDWLIVGGESGPKARPFNVTWAEDAIAQGRRFGVPVFVKQVTLPGQRRGRVSTDMAEWPDSIRVREFPNADTRATGETVGGVH